MFLLEVLVHKSIMRFFCCHFPLQLDSIATNSPRITHSAFKSVLRISSYMHSFILWAPLPSEYFVPDVNVTEQGPFSTCNLADKQGPSQPLCFGRESSGGGAIHTHDRTSFHQREESICSSLCLSPQKCHTTSRGSVQDQAQNCYTPESSKKSLSELSRNLIPNGAGNWLPPVTAQALWLLLRSPCGCSRAWLASHEQCTTLLSSLLLTGKARISGAIGLFLWLWVWFIPLGIKYFWDTHWWFSHLLSTQGTAMLEHCANFSVEKE